MANVYFVHRKKKKTKKKLLDKLAVDTNYKGDGAKRMFKATLKFLSLCSNALFDGYPASS